MSLSAFIAILNLGLNSLRDYQPPLTQATIFNNEVRQVIHPLKVTFGGMTLAQLNGILQAHQLDTKLIYAADIAIEQFRSLTPQNLSNPDDLMLVNYRLSSSRLKSTRWRSYFTNCCLSSKKRSRLDSRCCCL